MMNTNQPHRTRNLKALKGKSWITSDPDSNDAIQQKRNLDMNQ